MSQEEQSEEQEEQIDFKAVGDGNENPIALFSEIDSVLSEAEEDLANNENAFQLPLPRAISQLPEKYRKKINKEFIEGRQIVMALDTLYEQLRNGKVRISISDLAYFIPLNLIYRAALDDDEQVDLPLQSIVRSLGTERLKDHTPSRNKVYDITGIEDPFAEGELTSEASTGVVIAEEEEEEPAAGEDIKPEQKEQKAAETVSTEAPPIQPVPEVIDKPEAITSAKPEVTDKAPEPDQEPAIEQEKEEQESTPSIAGTVSPVSDNSVEYPLIELVRDMFPETLPPDIEAKVGNRKVSLTIPDLFDQLQKGKVEIQPEEALKLVPPDIKADFSLPENNGLLTLSLSKTVEAIGTDRIIEHTPSSKQEYEIDNLADPFEEPEELPPLVRQASKTKKAPPVSEAVHPRTGEAHVEPDLSSQARVVPYIPEHDPEEELKYHELPGNININAAGIEELKALDGVNTAVAEAIVAHREKNKGFQGIFELLDIPAIDEQLFRRMTGMSPRQKRYHRRKRLAGLLKMPPASVTNLNLVAEKLSAKVGFSGCVIADNEGLVLARSGVGKLGEGLSAVIPRMVKQIRHNMNLAGAGTVGTVTMAIDGVLYTVFAAENMSLLTVHEESRISKTELVFLRKVARELAWLLSLRAYVGLAIV